MPGVVVMVQGTNNGVSTDLDGHYVLPLKGQKNPVIVFRSIGYSTQEIAVNGRTTIDVSLSPDYVVICAGAEHPHALEQSGQAGNACVRHHYRLADNP
ncbi:MAG: carboxypeptidase-like regulatory domain-containing protein [Bacteroidota bacterium]|nr:carboxypeptidase-like regulatory domain-containing protein [Bacteroidota bacterium]